jgi:hypothetical protein
MTKPEFSGASAEASVPCKCLQYCANTLVFQGKPPTDGYYFGPAIFAGIQPFGGTALSGTGVQTGSEDYLRQFVWPRVVSSNPLRHGYVPGTSCQARQSAGTVASPAGSDAAFHAAFCCLYSTHLATCSSQSSERK